ncbi:DUF993 family protein [Agromyces mediolanus]|uniref:DUF993 family protein n=1 Tax=Agromyces mediolanus TaxID=41986 RepID=UPI001E603375|nr:DUF993 family protein [Agromyces mediolanus]MCD1572971.1 dihydrodipicolinate synthase family protein [Agromyces mediolanus]
MTALTLLAGDGAVRAVALREAPAFTKPGRPPASRVAYAAAHVVPRASADNTPGVRADIDWDATLAFRHHVWSWGLGVADAMDTAQRNMGLDPAATRELISRSAAEANAVGGRLVVGVNTDHLEAEHVSLAEIVDAYRAQLHHAEDAGAGAVLMASRHLARAAQSAEDYRRVYGEVLAAAGAPVVLHWLGPAFDPVLAGYFTSTEPGTSDSDDVDAAADTLLDIIAANPDRVSGVKMSLLDADAEIAVRRRLPATARMFTGDDFHYVGLIEGDGTNGDATGGDAPARPYSDALLGAFAAVAPNASAAIQALDAGDVGSYRAILGPTEELSRQVFAAPTYYYKTGVAFLAWLNGHQPAFQMVGGLHAARSLPHLSRIVELANEAGALERPELAAARWHSLLGVNGIEARSAAVPLGAGA